LRNIYENLHVKERKKKRKYIVPKYTQKISTNVAV
jgi:hypothetical protein